MTRRGPTRRHSLRNAERRGLEALGAVGTQEAALALAGGRARLQIQRAAAVARAIARAFHPLAAIAAPASVAAAAAGVAVAVARAAHRAIALHTTGSQ